MTFWIPTIAVSLGRLQRPWHDVAGATRRDPDHIIETSEGAALTASRPKDVS